MATMREVTKALEELQNEADVIDLNIVKIETASKITVSIYDNPLTPQAVFAVMNCFIAIGAKKVEWLSPNDRDAIDLIATF